MELLYRKLRMDLLLIFQPTNTLLFSQTFFCFKMLKKILTPVKGVTEHLEYNYNFPSFTEVETHVECVLKYYVYECPLTNIYSNLVPR